ncbi:MAG TPA: hypothetical protein VNN08_17915, partial [Thermoanaerobaculia bacterium]|nr:hypothetical protein [Thermoanaerobaculia bacterium]
DAARQLAERRTQLTGERILLHMRATSGERSQSFRAQLQISSGRMLLTAYTPIGTSAIRLYATGDEVTFINDLEDTWWHGSSAEFASDFGFFGATPPAAMALLIAGLPADENAIAYDYAAAGLSRASVGDVVVTFEPPSYPPKHVTIVRGVQKLEIDTLESAMTSASIVKPDVPKQYRCCVAPRL